jgi:glycerol kinase
MKAAFIMALDQGTTSTRAILFNRQGELVHRVQQEFPQYYPNPGWVEHNTDEIWQSLLHVVSKVLTEEGTLL